MLIIASMIEREAAYPADRAKIAAVIYNRLHADMPLGIDATIQYSVGSWRVLTARDLRIKGGYNTRTHRGLPPTPICNPGLASLKAAAHPANVKYLYYVAIPGDPKRRHHFSKYVRGLPALPGDAPGMTIRGATRVACVIGDPVEHSRSPLMHNAAAAALGLDRVYVALRVRPGDLEAAVRGLAALGFDGANVTIPHKADAVALCDELGGEARDARAVNTLSFSAAGVRGDLTDGLGLIAALDGVPARALLLGREAPRARPPSHCCGRARGTSRSWRAGPRPPKRWRRRSRLWSRSAHVTAAASAPPEAGGLLVNCTPIGGIADLKGLPAPADVIERMDAIADFAYRADGSPTPLAAAGAAAGRPVVDGLELLVRQGGLSFRRWTGIEPPLDVMRRAARGE